MSLGRLQLQFTSKDFIQECVEFTWRDYAFESLNLYFFELIYI